jgi:tRNA pseudouridine65 synthase
MLCKRMDARIHARMHRCAGRATRHPVSEPLSLVFVDSQTVVVAKPSGMLVHNSAYAGPPEQTVVDLVRAQCGVQAVPIHRLDRGCSGVLLLATDAAHAGAWNAALAEPTTRKRYWALVRGHLKKTVDVDHPLTDDKGVPREARSRVSPVWNSPHERCGLVEVEIFTGRTHQVRRHLDHITHPMIGDTTYGKGPINRQYRTMYGIHRLCLHAAALHIRHPFTGVEHEFTAPLPPDLALPLERLKP